MSAYSRLTRHTKLYDTDYYNQRFFEAIIENLTHHMRTCPEYEKLLRSQGFDPICLKTPTDLYKIPPLPTQYLKRHPLFSVPEDRLMLKSTTSGTSGSVSIVGFDKTTAMRGLGMVLKTFFTHKLPSLRLTNYIVLGYEPAKRNRIGAAKTAYATTFAAPALHREYALKDMGDSYELNLDGICESLSAYSMQNRPVRFIGFPSYFFLLLQEFKSRGIKLKLHPGSLIMLAGGWKQFFTQREGTDLCALVKPRSASNSAVRTPKRVSHSSTVLPPTLRLMTSLYK